MEPVHMCFGGYQPPTSVHTKAAEVLGHALTGRLGQAIRFDLNSNIVASGHNAADLLPMVENGTLTLSVWGRRSPVPSPQLRQLASEGPAGPARGGCGGYRCATPPGHRRRR